MLFAFLNCFLNEIEVMSLGGLGTYFLSSFALLIRRNLSPLKVSVDSGYEDPYRQRPLIFLGTILGNFEKVLTVKSSVCYTI